MKPPAILIVPFASTLCDAAFAVRREVFVVEQHVPAAVERDADDETATHFVAIADGEAVGTLRMVPLPEHLKIGRVAVAKRYRGRGIAKAMMLAAMQHATEQGQRKLYLTSQTDKIGFYEKLGFVAFGDEFQDGGMPHRAMKNYSD